MGERQPLHELENRVGEHRAPFHDEADVMIDYAAQHDDISVTQSSGNAAVEVSAEHVSELLYEPGYIWDPRSSPEGVEYYPAYPDSSEGESTPT